MSRQPITVFQHAFNKGELSPDLRGRKDWQPIYHGAASAKNVIVKTSGGVIKAPGTIFLGEALEQSTACRFIKFQFSDTQSYILEFGDYKFRIIQNGAFVQYPEAHENAGEIVVLEAPFSIGQMQNQAIKVDIGSRNCDYAQDNDTIIIVHPDVIPKILTRYDHHDWRWEDLGIEADLETPQNPTITVDGGNDISYRVSAIGTGNNNELIESFPSAIVTTLDTEGDGATTLAWSAVEDATKYRVYRQYENATGYEWRMIGEPLGTTYSDTKGATGNANIRPKPEVNPFNQVGRYPAVCVFHGNRLVMGSPNEKPNRVYGSRLGDFRNFALPDIGKDATDEDAYEWNITGGSTSPIFTALISNTELIMLSTSGEFRVDGERPAVSFGSKIQSHYGSTPIRPILYRQAVIFVGKNRRSLNAFTVSPLTGNYDATEISHFSSHIFEETRIMSIADQQTPFKNIYCVMENGTAAIVTFMADQEVLGVSRRITDGKFEVVESIDANGETDVYFQTVRIINGEEKRYIEMMAKHHERGQPLRDAWYVDCGLEYSGEPKSAFTGLGHLEGRNVVVNADGYGYGYDGEPITVTDGQITIPVAAAHVIAGLGYEAELKTLDMGPQGDDPGSRTRAPVMATVNFLRTRDCRIACEGSEEKKIEFLADAGKQTYPNEVEAKTFLVPADPNGSVSSSLTLRSRSPFPWGIARIDMVVNFSQTHNMRG